MNIHSYTQPKTLNVVTLHPVTAPQFHDADGVIEFTEDSELVLPTQMQFRDVIVRLLNELKQVRGTPDVIIEHCLQVDTTHSSDHPTTQVVRICGQAASTTEVLIYRAAVQYVLNELLCQMEAGSMNMEPLLTDAEKEFLDGHAQRIRSKFACKKVKRGFVIDFLDTDTSPVAIQGTLPELEILEKQAASIEGTARAYALDEAASRGSVWLRETVTDSSEPYESEKLEFFCGNTDFLRVLARSFANQTLVSFKAIKQTNSKTKKSVWTLTKIQEIETTIEPNHYHYELEMQQPFQ
ncbi:MAG: hypothetical protein AWU57_1056 [Marinobacter sp. T13-3]|nr:MAG: hypothetical protein AWU57_1056 [Marinobacter sp. T13-3]